MVYIVICLIIIILLLIIYLILLKKELKNIEKEIDFVKNDNTNALIRSKYYLKSTNNLTKKINYLIEESKKIESVCNRKNRSLEVMITNITHDLRTPLTSALGYIDLILGSNLTEKEKNEELVIVKMRIKRLEELINSFFEFSKVITMDKKQDIEKVNVIAILEETIARFYDDFKQNKRKIILERKEKKIITNSNKIMLERIFDNLIVNAYKHSDSDLKIQVTLKQDLKIEFINEFKDKELDVNRIFDEFYTVDISRTKGETGLGLAIVKEFVKQLGGNVYAKKKNNFLKIILEFNDWSNQ